MEVTRHALIAVAISRDYYGTALSESPSSTTNGLTLYEGLAGLVVQPLTTHTLSGNCGRLEEGSLDLFLRLNS
jgi:hypothetical protein